MTQAIRNALRSTRGGAHAGLILSRYLNEQESGGEKPERANLYDRAQAATGVAKSLYEKSFARWQAAWQFTPHSEKPYRGSMRTFSVDHMIIGLGSDSVLETGLTLHHTYGVPYIPGSAVKGLCAHYCHELGEGFQDGSDLYKTIFGDTSQAGMIRFHDALIEPESLGNCLKDDVMTPHHSAYYGSNGETAPTDFDSPTPVTFLSVSGKFLFVISCDDVDEFGAVTPLGKRWLAFVWSLLGGALSKKGIGGKTNSGYGFGTRAELPAPPEPPPRERNKGDRETLKRIRKEKGDLVFEASDEDESKKKICVVLKNDQPLAKKIPIGSSVEMIYYQPLGDKLQFELTPELREELAKQP